MWEEPHIPNHGDPGRGLRLKASMTLAIEPMLTTGGEETGVLADEWTVVSTDGSWSAHFEHTVAVTDAEPLILTRRLHSMVQ
jgi:methionyl aminopeptidase